MKHQAQNTRKMLEQRIAAIEEFLAKRLVSIQQVRKERYAETLWYEQETKRLQHALDEEDGRHRGRVEQCQTTLDECAQQITEAETRIRMATNRLAEEETLHARQRVEALSACIRHNARYEPIRSKWRQRLRLFQDGMVRRKRHELAKLKRRFADKVARAEARRGHKRLTAEEIATGELPAAVAAGAQGGK